ncbi:MAG: efflux RND transporter permease subunit, partial [Gemmatimonadetes bacterium]|nr:efflux RND transporter permease subunit [Gemmatimonadota bacterium]
DEMAETDKTDKTDKTNRREDSDHLLPRLSVDRPVSVIMVLVAMLAVGAIAYSRIPLGLIPEGLEGDRLHVWVSYPNASPEEVEQKVMRPIEEAIATVPRVERVSVNANRGGCWTSVTFLPNTDMHEAYASLRDRMDRAMPELPDEVDRIQVRKWDQDDWPILYMGAYLSGDYADPFQVLDLHVRPELQRIEGVGTVEVWGEAGKQVRIELDQERLKSHGIEPWAIGGRLAQQNFTMPGGYVMEGGRKIYVRSMGRFESLEEIRSLIIDAEHGLRLGDIATVSLKSPKKDWFNRIDQRETFGIEVKRAASGNIVGISRAVRAKLDELRTRPHLEGIDFEILWDQGEHVTESVDNTQQTGMWGGLFAAMILFFFLRAVRMTAIITLAIPLSILITITTIYFFGWTLNLITMMGLMLSLGLVVDNAIVIVENIYRKREEGMAPREASIKGAGEVGLAVTMATLTTVVVFLPLMLMSDEEEFSFYMLRIGTPVIVGLLASLFIALAIIPLAAMHLGSPRKGSEPWAIRKSRGAYERVLKWVLNHRLDTTIFVIIAMASIQIPMNGMSRTDEGGGNRKDIWLAFEMPAGQTLEAADKFIGAVEDTLNNHREEYNIRVLETYSRNSWGRIHVIFNDEEVTAWYSVAWDNISKAAGWRVSGHLEYQEIVDDIKERLQMPPGVHMRVNWRSGGGADAAVTLNLYGEDTRVLVELSSEVERRLGTIPDLLSVQTDVDRGGTELQVRLNREQVRRYGVDPRAISGNIGYSLRGRELTRFRTDDGREISVFFQLEEVDRQSIQQLRNLTFKTSTGQDVPLESLAELHVERTIGGIRRENRQTVLTVTATATKDDAEKLFGLIDGAMAGFEMPRGYRWDKGTRYERIQESDEAQTFGLILSVTFVFLLMGVLFESFVLPLSVIVSIPFSFLGVYWTLYLTDTPFDMLSGIGTVILVGVVVNNAIVLIDMTNRLRADGLDRYTALVEAGRHRFRPILMTTFTTICGLIPMAVGNARMIGMPYAPLGRTMMGGLLASTVLTLVIVPLFYTYFDDLRTYVRRVMGAAVHRP